VLTRKTPVSGAPIASMLRGAIRLRAPCRKAQKSPRVAGLYRAGKKKPARGGLSCQSVSISSNMMQRPMALMPRSVMQPAIYKLLQAQSVFAAR